MDILGNLQKNAKANLQRIVLPESTEERTLCAADIIVKEGLADIILIGDPAAIQQRAKQLALTHIEKTTIFDINDESKLDKYAQLLYSLRKQKGLSEEEAKIMVKNPLYLACLMIKNGDADGEVAGAMNTTANVLRPALQIIKTTEGINVISGAFLMFTPNKEYGEDGVFVFADCAVTPNPTAHELSQIAISSAKTAQAIGGFEPRVAILSFSTKGSAKNDSVDKVIEATKLAKELEPSLKIDGELQVDAAIVPSVSERKSPGSEIKGSANVLVFPSLDVGNIAYKLVERLAGAEAVGPILQGMAAPVNDLSRGCSVDDIVKVVTITANQAIALKAKK